MTRRKPDSEAPGSQGAPELSAELGGIGWHMARGSAWMIAMRWAIRTIGLLSTIILARLLVPEDFGIVAMSMIVVGLLEVFGETGFDAALIQNRKATSRHYDTAWTFKILQGTLLCGLLVLIAPIAADYFNEPRVTPVIRILALHALIGGFQNIGIVNFRRDLNFSKEFRFQVYLRLLTFAVTVSLAVILRTYWALVVGIVTGAVLGVTLSYVMEPYRPRLSFKAASELWSFSMWILLHNLGRFAVHRTDALIVGRVSAAAMMGNYHMAFELSTMPIRAIVLPMGRALFPAYSKISHQPELLARSYRAVLGPVAMACIPMGFGLAALADEVVAVILGAKWMATAPLIQWLAIFGAVRGTSQGVVAALTALGRVKTVAFLTWLELVVLVPALVAAGVYAGVTEIAMTRAAVAVLFTPVAFFALTRVLPVSPGEITSVLWRPLVAAAVMVVAIRSAPFDVIGLPVAELVLAVMMGAVVFTTASFMLWWATGRPEGPEHMVIRYFGRVLGPAGRA
jgi:O-antigen/teichoic acid export membrane protein